MTHITRRHLRPLALLVMVLALSLRAQAEDRRSRPSTPSERQRWEVEMTEYKHDVLTRELGLKEEQKTQFFALYDALDRERRAAFGKARHARKAVKAKAKATDAELTEAARLEVTAAQTAGNLEVKYFNEYSRVLTPQQLFKLADVERKMMRDLRKHASGKHK